MKSALLTLAVSLGGCALIDARRTATNTSDGATGDASSNDGQSNVDAASGAPDAACTPSCNGSMLDTCQGMMSCALGCASTNGAHCRAIIPSNGATEAADLGGVTAGLNVTTNLIVEIDTDSGAIWSSPDGQTLTVVRAAGDGVIDGISFHTESGIGVFGVDSLTVAMGGYVRPFGTQPTIVLARGDIVIDGFVDASGGCNNPNGQFVRSCPGPGGGAGGTNSAAGAGCAGGGPSSHTLSNADSGGGGGGFGSKGGNGGDGDVSHKGGGGGTGVACTGAPLEPLSGGGGGGGGGTGADGGGGGGAIQLTSLSGQINVGSGAVIDAGGRGGGASLSGGGGGGAGGAILLEAMSITISGNVTANGGGGGAGTNSSNTGIGAKGSTTSATPAVGGTAGASGRGSGGNGGAGATQATNGDGPIDGGGGGGGGVGRIRFNVPAANLVINGGVISPLETRGDPTVE